MLTKVSVDKFRMRQCLFRCSNYIKSVNL